MSNIKSEFIEHSLSSITTTSREKSGTLSTSKWDAAMELELLNAIARCKPVGLHKHFRILCVQRQLNEKNPLQCTISEIWDRLGEYYGINTLNELEEEENYACQQNGGSQHEFSLPLLFSSDRTISDTPHDTKTRANSLSTIGMPLWKRPRFIGPDVSPALAESFVASTPEPNEAPPFRRTGRSTRKSEFETPEPGTTRSLTDSPPPCLSSPSSSPSHNNNKRPYQTSSTLKHNNGTAPMNRRQSKRK